jgi:hypothetical protein
MMTDEKPFVRRDLSSGNFEIALEDNRRNWRVYNVPIELISKYISYAKLHFDNEVWKVMDLGMTLILEADTTAKGLKERLETLESEVQALKQIINKEKNNEPITFGGNNQ